MNQVQNSSTDAPSFVRLSPALFNQYCNLMMQRIQADIPQLVGIVVLTGTWRSNGRLYGAKFYGAEVGDDGGASVKVNIQQTLLAGRGIAQGETVEVMGCLDVRKGKTGIDFQLEASDIRGARGEEAAKTAVTAPGALTVDSIRELRTARTPFPEHDDIKITLVRSQSAGTQVDRDCRSELDRVDGLRVIERAVNILDPVAVAQAISSADPSTDILMLIRGGGQDSDFAVFEDLRVLRSMAACPAHRVIGLGHSGNDSIMDMVCDHSARTPAQAGIYVRERIEARRRTLGEMGRELRLAKEQRDTLQATLASRVDGWPTWAIPIAFAAGGALAWVFR